MGKTGGEHRVMLNDAETKLAIVTAVIGPGTPAPLGNGAQILANVRPVDQSADHIAVPVFLPPGYTRNFRKGMLVKVFYVDGSPQLAVASGHTYSLDAKDSVYGDPLPPTYEYPDDMVIHHDETGFYMRWRNAGSTLSQAGADLSPCIFDAEFLSGLTLSVVEYLPQGYPPTSTTNPVTGETTTPVPTPPTRAKLLLSMPQGQSLLLDEPADGESTFTYTHPSGTTIMVDQNGAVTVDAAVGAASDGSPLGGVVTLTAGDPLSAILDAAGTTTGVPSFSVLAPKVALGDLAKNIPDVQSAIASNDMSTFEGNLFAQRLQDKKDTITALLAAMANSGTPSLPTAAAAFALLATAVHIPIPSGSSVLKFKA